MLGALVALFVLSISSEAMAQIVGASVFGGPGDPGTGSTGYRGDNLYRRPDSFAELGQGGAIGNALGKLPYGKALRVTNVRNGRSMVLYKRDVGLGGGPVSGRHRSLDLWFQAAQKLGINGLGLVKIEPINAPGRAPTPTPSTVPRPGVNKTVIQTPGVDRSAERQGLLFNYIGQRNSPSSLLNLATGLQGAQDTPATSRTVIQRAPGALAAVAAKGGGGVPGVYHFPIGSGHAFSEERTDRGQDFSTNPGGSVNAIGNARVIRASGNPFPGSGPLLQLLDGPLKGKIIGIGHARRSLVRTGQIVRAGQPVAVAGGVGGGGPGHIEIYLALDQSGRIDQNVGSDHYSWTGKVIHDLLHRLNPHLVRRQPIRG